MKIIIDILELYEDVSGIPKKESGAYFDEDKIILKALDLVDDYLPAFNSDFLVSKPRVKYLVLFSNEYPSRIPDKISFVVNKG